ncbi:MAG TPA: myxococcus cysteine-rich repeat containing protein [Vulgatibacter sp.]
MALASGCGSDPADGGPNGTGGSGGTAGEGGSAGHGGSGGDGGSAGHGGAGGDGGTAGDGGEGGGAGHAGVGGHGGTGGSGPTCGNGELDPGEECDDGNEDDGDGCSSSCEWEAEPIALPGGSIWMMGSASGEQWTRVGSNCLLEVGSSEYFHAFPIVNATPHAQRVRVRTSVLDWVVVLAYSFPFDPIRPESGCLVGEDWRTNRLHPSLYDLSIPPGALRVIVVSTATGAPLGVPPIVEVITEARCGDGIVGEGEACDDGNTSGGDGCSADCRTIEVGWTCAAPGSDCTPNVCGDGLLGGGEGCDDGNEDDGDGCAASCTVEAGHACPIPGEDCRPISCGDGFVDFPETCDPVGPGCSDACGIVYFDTQNAEKNMPFGATIPVGRWATRIMDQQPWVYSFDVVGGHRYVAEIFVGAPWACTASGGPGYTNLPIATLNLQDMMAGFPVVDSDDFKDGSCPRFEINPASDATMGLWIYQDGPGSADPMYVRVEELP